MTPNARIAHLAGPNATIQNTPPLVTSNKPRSKQGLTALTNPDGSPARFDVLRPQRLAAPVTVQGRNQAGAVHRCAGRSDPSYSPTVAGRDRSRP